MRLSAEKYEESLQKSRPGDFAVLFRTPEYGMVGIDHRKKALRFGFQRPCVKSPARIVHMLSSAQNLY
jgi:hypothetical protein